MSGVFVITAGRTKDGRAVYLRDDRVWSEDLSEALSEASEEELGELLAWAKGQQREVCDPYVMKAAREDDAIVAVSARERIRATGPAWIRERFGYRV